MSSTQQAGPDKELSGKTYAVRRIRRKAGRGKVRMVVVVVVVVVVRMTLTCNGRPGQSLGCFLRQPQHTKNILMQRQKSPSTSHVSLQHMLLRTEMNIRDPGHVQSTSYWRKSEQHMCGCSGWVARLEQVQENYLRMQVLHLRTRQHEQQQLYCVLIKSLGRTPNSAAAPDASSF
eukprot:COSAG05_NODE_2266_length_3307_cov_2.517768_2_plen_175_part_00